MFTTTVQLALVSKFSIWMNHSIIICKEGPDVADELLSLLTSGKADLSMAGKVSKSQFSGFPQTATNPQGSLKTFYQKTQGSSATLICDRAELSGYPSFKQRNEWKTLQASHKLPWPNSRHFGLEPQGCPMQCPKWSKWCGHVRKHRGKAIFVRRTSAMIKTYPKVCLHCAIVTVNGGDLSGWDRIVSSSDTLKTLIQFQWLFERLFRFLM